MKTQLSTYQKSYLNRQSEKLATAFPGFFSLTGTHQIEPEYIKFQKFHPSISENDSQLLCLFYDYICKHSNWRNNVALCELMRFELAKMNTNNQVTLFASRYPVAIKNKKAIFAIGKSLYYYALTAASAEVNVVSLSDIEYRIVNWLHQSKSFESIINWTGLLGYSHNRLRETVISLVNRKLISESQLNG